mgnify:CR=1 FL=1
MTKQTIKIAVIGVGYLGQYHAEKCAKIESADLIAVCDADAERAQEIAKRLDCEATTDYKTLIGKIDAACIVTPTPLHYKIAKFMLQNGVHLLVEKPITTTVAEADELIKIAQDNNCKLQVGHLERFNNALCSVKPLLENPRFIESTRLAPFQTRGSDVSVILDLMIHDIDLIQYLTQSEIKSIAATGASVLSDNIDICNARIEFENGTVANVTASRVNLKKVRLLRIFQHDSYFTINLERKSIACYKKTETDNTPKISSEEIIVDQGDALHDQ